MAIIIYLVTVLMERTTSNAGEPGAASTASDLKRATTSGSATSLPIPKLIRSTIAAGVPAGAISAK